MGLPLIVLAVATVFGGLIDLPFNHLKFLDTWLAPVAQGAGDLASLSAGLRIALLCVSVALALTGIFAARALWSEKIERPELEPAVLAKSYYSEEISSAVFTETGGAFSRILATVVDNAVIDGAVNGVAMACSAAGRMVRRAQTGYVRNYALGIAAGTVAILAFMLVRAA